MALLLLLVPVFPQSLLSLMLGYFRALAFFSAGHTLLILMVLISDKARDDADPGIPARQPPTPDPGRAAANVQKTEYFR